MKTFQCTEVEKGFQWTKAGKVLSLIAFQMKFEMVLLME